MIKFFRANKNTMPTNIDNTRLGRLKLLGDIELAKVKTYYNSSTTKVASNNPIVRLLKAIIAEVQFNDDHVRDFARANHKDIGRRFEFTNNASKGKVFIGTNMGADNLLIMLSNGYNFEASSKGWKELKPIRYLKNNSTNISLNHPVNEFNVGYTVIEIDLTLLMLQFKGWMQHTTENSLNIDIGNFVFAWTLTNAIDSYYDLSIMNGFFMNSADLTADSYVPFNIVDFSRDISKVINVRKNTIFSRPSYYSSIIDNIPVLYHDKPMSVISDNVRFPTYNNIWILWFIYTDWVYNLIVNTPNHNRRKNTGFIDQYKWWIRKYINNKIYSDVLDNQTIETYKNKEKLIITTLNSK